MNAMVRPASLDQKRSELAKVVAELGAHLEVLALAVKGGSEELVDGSLGAARAWLVFATGLKANSDADARMWFTATIDFYASMGPQCDHELQAAHIAGHVARRFPAAAKRVDRAKLERAIARRAKGRWSWKDVAAAWGRDSDPEGWRAEWNRWKR
jgi:hypothetical protein